LKPSFLMSRTSVVLLILGVLTACNSVYDPTFEDTKILHSPRIVYEGIQSEAGFSSANFTLRNDSTESITYFAYSENALHYSSEVLSDTGWVYLLWNWCGTGAEYLPLEAKAEVEFGTSLPPYSCTWRVLVTISGDEQEWAQLLYSEPLEYVKP